MFTIIASTCIRISVKVHFPFLPTASCDITIHNPNCIIANTLKFTL